MNKLQVCTRCVMDNTDPEISFDEKGVCNHCISYARLAPTLMPGGDKAKFALEKMVDEIRKSGKGKDYDCIVGISGGVDSSYVSLLSSRLGLRVLAVHFDNGWNSELAVKNIEQIVKKLGFDFQTYVVDWEEFRDLQRSFLFASVANAEIPTDHGFLAALYRIANSMGIKYSLSGSNFATEGILPKSWGYSSKDVKHLKGIHNKFGTIPLKTFPLLGLKKEIYYRYIKNIKTVKPLNLVDYKKTSALQELQEEIGWQYYGGKHFESVFTRFFQAYILPQKFNIDKRKAHLSSLINNGEISREESLEELKKPLYPEEKLREDKNFVLKKLELSQDQFEEIMAAPPKSYKDYPNQEAMIRKAYSVYHKLTGRR